MEKQFIFILSLFQHGDKVRYSTLAHLLRGKRTTSVLMYGFLYQLLPYFALFPDFSEEQLTGIIRNLIESHYLMEDSPGVVSISAKGRQLMAKKPLVEHEGLDSLRYSRVDDDFTELLLFATQVVSEYCHQQSRYQPIETSQLKQALVKGWLRQLPERDELGRRFFNEWQRLIAAFPEVYRPYVVASLSGNGQIGQTLSQLTEQSNLSLFEARLVSKQLSHRALTMLLENVEDFPLMVALYRRLGKKLVNESAAMTYQLFQQGWSVSELSKKRGLKPSTISEHLIEAAIIDESFDLTKIVTTSVRSHLEPFLVEPIRQWRYGDLKLETETVSFLAFRCFQIQQLRGGDV